MAASISLLKTPKPPRRIPSIPTDRAQMSLGRQTGRSAATSPFDTRRTRPWPIMGMVSLPRIVRPAVPKELSPMASFVLPFRVR